MSWPPLVVVGGSCTTSVIGSSGRRNNRPPLSLPWTLIPDSALKTRPQTLTKLKLKLKLHLHLHLYLHLHHPTTPTTQSAPRPPLPLRCLQATVRLPRPTIPSTPSRLVLPFLHLLMINASTLTRRLHPNPHKLHRPLPPIPTNPMDFPKKDPELANTAANSKSVARPIQRQARVRAAPKLAEHASSRGQRGRG